MRAMIAALAFLIGFPLVCGTAHADNDWIQDTIRERAAAHGVSGDRLVNVAWCESRFNPQAIGRVYGEMGLFQIAPGNIGLLPTFHAWGYSDPFNVWEAADFAARAFSQGMSSHWTCAR